jgi:hypothetical protein
MLSVSRLQNRWQMNEHEKQLRNNSSTTDIMYSLVYTPNADPHTKYLQTWKQNKRTFLSSAPPPTPFSTLSAINTTWTDVRSNPGLRGDTPANSKLHFLSFSYWTLWSRKSYGGGDWLQAAMHNSQAPGRRGDLILYSGAEHLWVLSVELAL